MNIKGRSFLTIILCLLLLISGCGGKKDEGSAGKIPQDPSVSAAPQTTDEPELYVPSEQVIEQYCQTWVYPMVDPETDSELMVRLILSEDGTAQMPVQDGIGQLLNLYYGQWTLYGDELLHLEMTPDDMSEGAEPILGDYMAVFGDFNSLTLSVMEDASPLVIGHQTEPATFFEETSFLDPSGEIREQLVCEVALNYVEAISGEPYPGVAAVDSWEEGMILVHLYEDAGDHIATLAWYLIDPVSLIGYDQISGEQIDFAPYYGYAG